MPKMAIHLSSGLGMSWLPNEGTNAEGGGVDLVSHRWCLAYGGFKIFT